MEPASLTALGNDARARIPQEVDAVFSITSLIAAAVGRVNVPHISWDDATYSAMDKYYPDFLDMAPISRRQSLALGERAVNAVDLAVYASDWAAEAARRAYEVSAERVAVVPFGANLEEFPSNVFVDQSIRDRSRNTCRLLWIGVEWQRKGGDIAVSMAEKLREHGV